MASVTLPSSAKTLGASGIAGSLITSFTNVGTSGDHVAQWVMGIGGVLIWCFDHVKTIFAAYKKGA